jgi:3-dehydroquinate dehydratase II
VRIAVINGPNLNLLGERDPEHYGAKTLEQINGELARLAGERAVELTFFQSNHEGAIIDRIHESRLSADGIIINPGALAHYSYAVRDALEAVRLPVVEVHLSDIGSRESWRARSVTGDVAKKVIAGRGPDGYAEALLWICGRAEGGVDDR